MANDLINHVYVMLLLVTRCVSDSGLQYVRLLCPSPSPSNEAFLKLKRMGFRASGLVNMWRFRESGTSRKRGNSEPFSIPYHVASLSSVVPELCPI